MKRGGRVLVCALGMLVLCAGARGSAADSNPYNAIIERNVFGLRPPPPPPAPPEKKEPPPDIFLTGIITVLKPKLALLQIPAIPAKGREPAKPPQSFELAEGQRDGNLEVLAIDEKARTVKVNYGGSVLSLNFKDNGIKHPASAKPMPGQGAPRGIPVPGFAANFRHPTPNRNPYYQRAVRYGGASGGGSIQAGGAPGGVPSFGGGTAQTAQPSQPNNASNLTPEQQTVMIELNRQRLEQEGSPIANLLPPTALTPPSATEPTQTPAPNLNQNVAPPMPFPGRPQPLPGRPF